jgi:hypothetical protein
MIYNTVGVYPLQIIVDMLEVVVITEEAAGNNEMWNSEYKTMALK